VVSHCHFFFCCSNKGNLPPPLHQAWPGMTFECGNFNVGGWQARQGQWRDIDGCEFGFAGFIIRTLLESYFYRRRLRAWKKKHGNYVPATHDGFILPAICRGTSWYDRIPCPWHWSSGTQAAASFWSLPPKPRQGSSRWMLVNASNLVFACLDYTEGSGPLQQMPACLEPCDLSP